MTFSLRAYQKIKELQPIHKFDIIHDNQGLGHGMLLMKHLLKIPVVATIHHPVTVDRDLDLAAAPSWRWKLRLKRWYSFIGMQSFVAKRMDRVITVSKKSAEDISRDFGVPMSKMRVVYNGTDGNLFKQNGNVVKEPNSLITVNSGDSPIKGVEYLLKAMKLLRNGIVPKLTIVGCAVPGGRNFNMVQEYGLEDIVTFTGRIDDDELVARYTSSEIAVVPSLYEGFGFPATEAMACGIPVIASNAGALPEVLGPDSKVGISVPPADPEALAAAIKRLMHDENARKTMGAAGRKRVEDHFNWRQAAEQTIAVYRELL